MLKSTNYLNFPISFLEGAGLSPNSKLLSKIVSLCILMPMLLLVTYLIIRKFWDTDGDIFVIAEVFESLTTCAQSILRKCLMFIHGKLIIEIMNDRCTFFWDYNLFGQKLGKSLEKMLILCKTIAKSVASAGVMTIGLFCIITMIDNSKVVPLMSAIPSSKIGIAIVYISQVLIMLDLMYILLGWDCFFLLMCTDLRIQFILLQKMIKSIDLSREEDEKSMRKIVKCTKHHRFLLKTHQKLNTVFSEYFIVLYIVTVVSASIHYYIVMFRSPGLSVSIKSICYLVGMLFQVALFFIIASNLENEIENLSQTIYNINWEVCENLKIRKQILFMLMKSQEPVCMEGGGMVHINRNEYVALVRLAFSIASLLGGMN